MNRLRDQPVLLVGLCGSDIRNLTTDSKKGSYPHIYGHEIVGEIVELDVTDSPYYKGQMVYIYPLAHCLECENCRQGNHESCMEAENYLEAQGGFAEYIAYSNTRVKRGAIYEIPKGKDPIAATLAEPMSSTYACLENINVSLGDQIVIIGAGPIGIFLAILARLRGASKIIMIDINQRRLDLAKKFEVDHTINSTKENIVTVVDSYTKGRKADIVISANPSVKAQAQSIEMVRKCGTVVFFGGVPQGILTAIDTNTIHYNNLWIYGHYGANSIQVEKAFDLALSNRFPAQQLITHILPLDKIDQGIELTQSGKALKVVLIPGGK